MALAHHIICLLLRFSLVVLVLLTPVCEAWALGGRLGIAAGYDDNVDRSSEKMGSAFVNYQLELYQALYESPDSYVEGYGGASFHEFFRLEDRHEILLGVSGQRRWFNGEWHTQVYVEGRSYRDQLVTEDDSDTLEVGLQVDHYWNERLKLGLLGYYSTSDFRNPYFELTTLSLPATSARQGQSAGQDQTTDEVTQTQQDRRDDCYGMVASAEYRFTADLSSDIKVFYQDNDSTLAWESYHGYGVEHGWHVLFNSRLGADIWGSWFSQDYLDRDDHQGMVAVQFGWQLYPQWMLSLEGQQLWHRSDLSVEDYSEKVATCGLSWSF